MRHGFDLSYKTWVHHDDPDLPPPPPLIDNTRQPQMSDMTMLLNDLSYIPPTNEHNKTSNKPTQATRNEFEELYARANEELYPEFFQNVFPISKGYKLPPSYYAIKKIFKTIELGYESIHACEHDRCLIRGDDNKDLDFCPSSHTAKEMIWHATGKCTEPGRMQHLVDGRAWKKFDTKYPDFVKEPRNVRLELVADGFNPFGNLSQAYSMWPVILTTYNLPPWLCMKESSFMMTLLIPGPKSPGRTLMFT
nr:hypothetical protein [Tanacetum cinerariifolium]